MKKTIISVFVIALAITACKSDKKVETSVAKEVKIVQEATTSAFKSVAKGSRLTWKATHLGGLQPRFGTVQVQSANVLVTNKVLTNASFVVNLASLSVDNFDKGAEDKGKLEGHLKSDDFFNIEKHPTVTFEMTKLTPLTGDYNNEMTGNLTIMGVTKSITFKTNVAIHPEAVAINSEDFTINRQDWGLSYHSEGDKGIPKDYLIDNGIGFTVNVKVEK